MGEARDFWRLTALASAVMAVCTLPVASDAQTPPPSIPSYANRGSFTEQEVTIGAGPWVLPGTISIPVGAGPFPAVVLVHGSGPNDRDETVGPNKPFRDLAWGLASMGVAVLRYDKRTRVHASRFQAIPRPTVNEEVIDDALAAIARLRGTARIDSRRLFVIGHSLGAMLVPRIARRDDAIGGFIMMAAPARPLEDAVVEQLQYIFMLDGVLTDQERAQLEQVRRIVARIKDPNLSPDIPAGELLGAPGSYWLDLRGYDPVTAALQTRKPMLILQGERDYQVTLAEFDRWRAAFSGNPLVTFKLYSQLNHLFIAGQGTITPDEYRIPGHVAEIVVRDIARWIAAH